MMEFIDHVVLLALVVQAWVNEKRYEAITDCIRLLRERTTKP